MALNLLQLTDSKALLKVKKVNSHKSSDIARSYQSRCRGKNTEVLSFK